MWSKVSRNWIQSSKVHAFKKLLTTSIPFQIWAKVYKALLMVIKMTILHLLNHPLISLSQIQTLILSKRIILLRLTEWPRLEGQACYQSRNIRIWVTHQTVMARVMNWPMTWFWRRVLQIFLDLEIRVILKLFSHQKEERIEYCLEINLKRRFNRWQVILREILPIKSLMTVIITAQSLDRMLSRLILPRLVTSEITVELENQEVVTVDSGTTARELTIEVYQAKIWRVHSIMAHLKEVQRT